MPALCIIPARALADDSLTASDLRALLAIGHFTSRDGTGVWASRETIAGKARLDESTYRRSLNKLVERGYVRRERRQRKDGGDGTSMLAVVLDEPPAQAAPARGEGGESPSLPRGVDSPPGGRLPHLPEGGATTPQTTQSNDVTAAGTREKPPAVRLTAAVNAAFDAKLGTNRNPITSGTAANLVEAVQQHGIALEFAERHLFAAATAMDRAPRSMQYFTPGLVEAWAREQARADAGDVGDLATRVTTPRRSGDVQVGPQRLSAPEIWQRCVDVGLTSPMLSRDTMREAVERLVARGAVVDGEAFLGLVLELEPATLAEIKFAKTREERLRERLGAWASKHAGRAA